MSVNTEAIWVDRSAKAVLVIRILVGWVFLSEGIQKFGFPVRSEMDVLRKSSSPLAAVHGSFCRSGEE